MRNNQLKWVLTNPNDNVSRKYTFRYKMHIPFNISRSAVFFLIPRSCLCWRTYSKVYVFVENITLQCLSKNIRNTDKFFDLKHMLYILWNTKSASLVFSEELLFYIMLRAFFFIFNIYLLITLTDWMGVKPPQSPPFLVLTWGARGSLDWTGWLHVINMINISYL